MHSVSGFAGRLVPHAKGGIGVVESLGPRGTSPKGSKSDLADDNARLCQLLQSNQTLSSVGFSADPRPTQAYLATVQLGCLVLQVSGADNSIATGRDLAEVVVWNAVGKWKPIRGANVKCHRDMPTTETRCLRLDG